MNGPDQAAAVRAPRSRCAPWLSALLLCVMFAAVGLPSGTAASVGPTSVEFGDGHRGGAGVRRPAIAAATEKLTKGSVVATATTMLPRPVGRARRIEAGGLPPTRAPTG